MDQDLDDANAMYSSRSCHSTTSGTYGWQLADKPNDTCKCASEVPSSTGVLRWTPTMVVVVVVVEHLLLVEAGEIALVVAPDLACNICQ